AWLQQYGLNLEQRLFPLFRLVGYGFYESGIVTGTTDGILTESEARRWTVSGRAVMGDPVLGAQLGYDRSVRSADALSGGLATLGTDLVRETWSLIGTWRPEGLPVLNLRLSRTDVFDERRTGADQTTDEVSLGTAYQHRGLDARYRMLWQDLADRLRGTETATLSNGARLGYSDRILDDRVSLYGSYDLVHISSETTVTGAGGTVATQQFPVAGLSAVEVFPATPDRVALPPNGTLVDGDVLAGAGLNIGFGPTLSGDAAYRDLGVQFADVVTPVNTVWIWVDRPLPATVSGAFLWTAYRSDDNLNWTQVPLGGPVAFAPFNNRFEIPVAPAQARYLKLVVKPLAAAVTTDVRYRDILVTEMQVFQVVAAETARGTTSSLRGNANASARVQILTSVPLSYDFAATLSHHSARPGVYYGLTNGLSLSQPLAPIITLDARLERSDLSAGQGHEAISRASASLGAQPLPTVGGNLSYSGQLQQGAAGGQSTHNLSIFGRADPYRGVSLNASASYTLSALADGGSGRQGTAQASVGLTPNRWLVLGGSWSWSSGRVRGGARGDSSDVQSRLDGTATVNPAPAIFASVSLARVWANGVPHSLLNLSGSVSPFPGGDLYLGFAYNETLDTRSELRVRGWGPSMRWKIRGATYLSAAYSVLDSTSPALDVHSRTFTARLALALP
ncbi:MAG TPA: hypothetical protein VFI16_10655, partial [Anaeromyxobacteraceae bacterium]|nr:hypothetical protein [Anaeromyxobacteraceae bacterium]